MLTIVAADMVGYSILAGRLEQAVGSNALELLHQQLTALFDSAIARAQINDDDMVGRTIDTGDGEKRCFKTPEAAMRYAEAIQLCSAEIKETWWFRVGVASGDVKVSEAGRLTGFPLTVATRLETAAFPGQVVIDVTTYAKVSDALKRHYGEEETITEKHGENFSAHRRSVIPWSAPNVKAGIKDKVINYVKEQPLQSALIAASVVSSSAFIAEHFGLDSSSDVAFQFSQSEIIQIIDIDPDSISELLSVPTIIDPAGFHDFITDLADILIGN